MYMQIYETKRETERERDDCNTSGSGYRKARTYNQNQIGKKEHTMNKNMMQRAKGCETRIRINNSEDQERNRR